MKTLLLLVTSVIFYTGCSFNNTKTPDNHPTNNSDEVINEVRSQDYKGPYADTSKIYQDLNGAIVAVADQLFTTNMSQTTDVILTSFVDLNQLNKTTTFGRLLGESMYNELHIRKFNVTDFRGQDAISVNADGEFHITRDVTKLKDHIEAVEYVVVGTYVKFESNSVLINARILDSESGKVISTARIIYKPHDCSLFDICKKPGPDGINIVTDNCSKVGCPKQLCKDGICDNSTLY
ncbi:MAG: hypothetical protein IE909_00930 [Campylobacterales bacterium]|nr:hypothetical protein [Campylobacterales bacterium]